MKKQYRTSLLNSGELCSTCGIGMVNGYLKLSASWRIPLILVGGSLMEEESAPPEKIYDIRRYKAIMADGSRIDEQELNRFLIYPNLSSDMEQIYAKIGKFGKIIHPLIFLPKQSEEEIGKLLAKEMDWQDRGKHFDCVAEPFSNYLREHRYGYSRRVCQYSNLIRIGELTREQAIELLAQETFKETEKRDMIINRLEISSEDLERAITIAPFKYEKYCYSSSYVLKKFMQAGHLSKKMLSRLRG
jgi:hypothetical protein